VQRPARATSPRASKWINRGWVLRGSIPRRAGCDTPWRVGHRPFIHSQFDNNLSSSFSTLLLRSNEKGPTIAKLPRANQLRAESPLQIVGGTMRALRGGTRAASNKRALVEEDGYATICVTQRTWVGTPTGL
jgi:hypothetical protein